MRMLLSNMNWMFQVSTLNVFLGLFLVPMVTGLPLNDAPSTQRNDPAYDMYRNFAGSFPPYANPMNFLPQGFPNPAAYFPGGQFPFGGGVGGGGGAPFIPQYPGSIYGQYPGQIPFGTPGGVVPGYGPPVNFGQYGNSIYPILNGMGYSGPFYGSEVGVANPSYGNTGSGGFPPSSSPGAGAGAFASGGTQQTGGVPIVNTRFNNGAGTGRPGGSSSVVRTSDGGQVAVSVKSSPDGRPIFRSQTVQGPNSSGTAFAFASQSKA